MARCRCRKGRVWECGWIAKKCAGTANATGAWEALLTIRIQRGRDGRPLFETIAGRIRRMAGRWRFRIEILFRGAGSQPAGSTLGSSLVLGLAGSVETSLDAAA